MGANQENLLQAQIEFCDGWHDVLVTPIQQGGSECEPQGAFWVVRQSPLLLAWYKRYYSNDMQVTSDGRASPAVSSLAGVLDTIARQTGEHLFQARRLLPELGNVILRDYSQALQAPYTTTVHRDLDEQAVANLSSMHASCAVMPVFLNFWVPLSPVKQDHLGICCPDSVDLCNDAGGFKNLEGDRTGLHHRAHHRWVYVPDLKPGDVLIWRSEIVYHASLSQPSNATPAMQANERRKSLDLRLLYLT